MLAIDIILRYTAAKSYLSIGSTIYPRPDERSKNANYLGKGKDVWFGYHQSVRPCEWKQFTLNIDQKVTAFYRECNMIDFCAEYFQATPNDVEAGLRDKKYKEQFEKVIKGMTFASNYETKQGKHMLYKINGLDEDAINAKFDKGGQTITVADYFATDLLQPLKGPKLPCVRVGSKNSKRKKLFPMEKCLIVNDQKVKKLEDDDVAKIIKIAVATGMFQFFMGYHIRYM